MAQEVLGVFKKSSMFSGEQETSAKCFSLFLCNVPSGTFYTVLVHPTCFNRKAISSKNHGRM